MNNDIKNNDIYTSNEITYLKDLEPVRKRPGMYMGAEEAMPKQMISEAIDNSVDECLAGHNTKIIISINTQTGLCEVRDYGRGIPTELHPVENISTLELVLTKLHAGGKFGQSGYKFSGGLHGVGISATNALSKEFICRSYRNNEIYEIRFEKGVLVQSATKIDVTNERGTYIGFIPDFELLPHAIMPTAEEMIERLKEIALLNINVEIILNYNDVTYNFLETSFNKSLYKYVNDLICEPIHVVKNEVSDQLNKNFELNCLFSWSKKQCVNVCFTNGIRQLSGGDHLRGAQSAITDILLKYIQEYQQRKNKRNPVVISDDVKTNLCILISLKMVDPRFTSQTKEKLSSIDARNFVKKHVLHVFNDFMEQNISQAQIIIDKIIECAEIRESSQKEKGVVQSNLALPASLAVCTSKKPEECELLIVEGDGAGGSARMGRDRYFQAVLPINGKLLNVIRATPQKIYNSQSIKSLMASIGIKYKTFNVDELKYGKIIILTDADTDGLHILTLLLIFFIHVCPEIVIRGYIYVVYPPLYKVTINKKVQYARNTESLNKIIYQKFANSYELIKNDVILNAENVESLYLLLSNYFNECKLKNMHIDSTLVMTLCYHTIDELRNIFKCTVQQEYENEHEKCISITSIYGYNKYIINKINTVIKYDIIKYNNINYINIYDAYLFIHENKNKGIVIQRFKGLGEMNANELEYTCLDVNNRHLVQLSIEPENVEKTFNECRQIMDNTEERRTWLRQSLGIDIEEVSEQNLINDEIEDIANNDEL